MSSAVIHRMFGRSSVARTAVTSDIKISSDRAATMVGVFVRGTLEADPAEILAKLEGDAVYDNLATFLVKVAGSEHMVLRGHQIAEWLKAQYAEGIAKIKSSIEVQEEFAADLKDDVAGFHASKLHKLYQKKIEAVGEPSSDEDNEDDED